MDLTSLARNARDSLERAQRVQTSQPAIDIATVMGTRLLAEQPSIAQLEEALKEATELPHCHNKNEVYRQIAEHINATVGDTLK